MLHDVIMSRISRRAERAPAAEPGYGACDAAADTLDRRTSDRVPYPAEAIVVWTHDLASPMRYRVIDAGDGGYRIHSSMPLLEGTTGMLLRLLPGRGRPMDQPVMVAWIKPAEEEATGYDVGLRIF